MMPRHTRMIPSEAFEKHILQWTGTMHIVQLVGWYYVLAPGETLVEVAVPDVLHGSRHASLVVLFMPPTSASASILAGVKSIAIVNHPGSTG